MLSIEERFVGAYMWALEEALSQTRVKGVVDVQIATMFEYERSMVHGGLIQKRRGHSLRGRSLVDMPIIVSLRYQRDFGSRTRFLKHQFLECSRQEKRDAHDRAVMRSTYLAYLLEGIDRKEALRLMFQQCGGGTLFTSDIVGLAKDGLLLSLTGDERSQFPHVSGEARTFSAACAGATHGPKVGPLVDWQERLIADNSLVKSLGSRLFKVAYGYL